MAQVVYFIKASWFKAWDWCPRKVYLEAKYGIKEKPGIALAEWIIKHDFFCNYKEVEFKLISQHAALDKDGIREHLIDKTKSTLEDVIAQNENKVSECIENDLERGRSVPKQEDFIRNIKITLAEKLKELATIRAQKLKEFHFKDFKFLREQNPYSKDECYGFLKNYEYGVGARPDFVIFVKSEDIYKATVYDVKPKLPENRKGELLQNIAGHIAVEANLKYLTRKLNIDEATTMATNHYIFEYDTGREHSFSVQKDKDLLLDRARALRGGNFPRKNYYTDWKCKRCGIASQCANPKYA